MHLSANEIKRLLGKWHCYKAATIVSAGGSETERNLLVKKLNAIEKAAKALEERKRLIITMRFFEKNNIDIIAVQTFMSRRTVYYHINTAINDMVYIIENTYNS